MSSTRFRGATSLPDQTPATPRSPVRPVPRLRVLAGLAAGLAMIAGIVLLAESLRHPPPQGGPLVPEIDGPEADPRFAVECDGPGPREGQEREDPNGEPVLHEVTSNQLYDCPQSWHGKTVRYRGEAVGGVLQRPYGAWVHLNDDVYGDPLGPLPTHRDYRGGNAGVGVLLPLELAQSIGSVGGPQTRGDILEVVGTFHRVDPDTREVAVLRAIAGSIVLPGQPLEDPTLPDRRLAAIILVPLALAAVITERVVARRR